MEFKNILSMDIYIYSWAIMKNKTQKQNSENWLPGEKGGQNQKG